MNDLAVEVISNAQQGFADLIQFGIDLGIPFDVYPKTAGEIAYLQYTIQWVIFVFTICTSSVNGLVRSCMGSLH